MMHDSTDKVKLFVAANRWPDALQTVEVMRADPGDAIAFLESKCRTAVYARQIEELRVKVFFVVVVVGASRGATSELHLLLC